MEEDSWIQIILLVILIAGAAYCAASEISFASLNKIRIKNYAYNGNQNAKKALYILDNFDQALTTILVLNNLTHISFAALATFLSVQFWGIKSVKYMTIFSTILLFLVSELIPKIYSKKNSNKFALTVSSSLLVLMKILSPVTSFFMIISQKIAGLFPEKQEPDITEEEFCYFMEKARVENVIDKKKHELLYAALDFDVITVGDIFVPLENVVAINIDSTKEEILKTIKKHKYSRLPVYKNNIYNIIGVLQARKFLKFYIKRETFNIEDLLLKPYFIRETTPLDEALKDMSSKKFHMSIVVDNCGKILGILTIEDILEELVGEIWDENDI